MQSCAEFAKDFNIKKILVEKSQKSSKKSKKTKVRTFFHLFFISNFVLILKSFADSA